MKRALLAMGMLLAAVGALAGPMQIPIAIGDLYQQGQLTLLPDWKPLGKNYRAAVFVQSAPPRTAATYLAAWTDYELPFPEYYEKEKAYLSIRERMLLDCKGGKAGISSASFYAGQFGSGAIVAVKREDKPDMLDVVPDSIEDRLLKQVCPAPKRVRHRAAPHKK